MKKQRNLWWWVLPLWLLVGCDVHEWPDKPERVKLHLCLRYQTEMTEWLHHYNGSKAVEIGLGKRYDNTQQEGIIRYDIHADPTGDKPAAGAGLAERFRFTKPIPKGYPHEQTLELMPGAYRLQAWSDLIRSQEDAYFYETDNFAEIRLQGKHKANTDYRDAFRGSDTLTLVSNITEQRPDTLCLTLERPLAKFEFITQDVMEFIDKESLRLESKGQPAGKEAERETPTKTIRLEDYRVVFYYVGFMPDAYSLHTDKPVDSSTGVSFESSLKRLNDKEASMGFDYVLVNDKQSAVTVQIGIYDKEGTQLSLTDPIEVPLKRSHHTLLQGTFLLSESSGGVVIDPDFDGDHNIVFP